MKTNSKKLFIFLGLAGLLFGGVLWAYSRVQATSFQAWKRASARPSSRHLATANGARASLLSQEADIRALADRDARHARSPAFVPGSDVDGRVKSAVERALAGAKFAAVHARLKELIPDASPEGFWIRAAMTFGSVPSSGALSPELFAASGAAYAQVLAGEESAVTSLQSALRAIPRTEGVFRQQAFRMLSDIGLRNREMRNAAKTALLAEAERAGSAAEAAVAYRSILRMNPTREWAAELAHVYGRAHPGSDLSDFAALKVADL
jgi:hypothetical protein